MRMMLTSTKPTFAGEASPPDLSPMTSPPATLNTCSIPLSTGRTPSAYRRSPETRAEASTFWPSGILLLAASLLEAISRPLISEDELRRRYNQAL